MAELILFVIIGTKLQMGAFYWGILGMVATYHILKILIDVVTGDG